VDRDAVRELLEKVERGEVSPRDATELLSRLSTADLGFARLDRHRALRRGLPEVVFGQGKSESQLDEIVASLVESGQRVLVTRIERTTGERLAERYPEGRHDPISRTFRHLPHGSPRQQVHGLLVVSAGTSDLPVAEEAAVAADTFGLAAERLYDVGVAGVHRLLENPEPFRRARVIIVVAGMEGALPSVVTGLVRAPVIGVPTSVGYGAALSGWTSLLGMLSSCASGLTVVNIDNGLGAACAAHAILIGATPEVPPSHES